MNDILKYFNSVKAQKQIDKLAKKYKNKKIVIYGAGEYFKILKENFDISGLNIVAISDKKFVDSKEANFTNYCALSPEELANYDFDIILVALYNDIEVCNYLENNFLFETKNESKKVLSIIEPTLSYVLKVLLTKCAKQEVLIRKLKNKCFNTKEKRYLQYYKKLFETYDFLKKIVDFNYLKLEGRNLEEIKMYFINSENYLKSNKFCLFTKNKVEKICASSRKLIEMLEVLSEIADINHLKPAPYKSLREHQLRFLEFCKEITDIFDKNEIRYFLMGGSLIGAIRHEGFIPWDDDIDLGMLRSDYEKLKDYLRKNAIKIDISKMSFSKINFYGIINSTLKKNPNKLVYMIGPKYIQIYRGTSLKNSVYIDIFPHDYYQDSYTMEEHNEYVNRLNSEYIKKDNFKDVLEFFENEIQTNKNIVEKSNKIYFSIDNFVSFIMVHKKFIDEDMIFPLKKMKFEHYEFYVPNKEEAYVSVEFPNYKNLPKEIEITPSLKRNSRF